MLLSTQKWAVYLLLLAQAFYRQMLNQLIKPLRLLGQQINVEAQSRGLMVIGRFGNGVGPTLVQLCPSIQTMWDNIEHSEMSRLR